MKHSFVFRAFCAVVAGGLLLSAPVFGEDTSMLNQALDLVHQAWNPGGDPPGDAQRIDMLTKALKLTQQAPHRHLRGFRVEAISNIRAALEALKHKDPDHKVDGYLHDADAELRTALS